MPPETLGAKLRAARKSKGLTLRAVERATGINNAHLSQIESGTILRPEMAMLWELAGVYDLDYGELVASGGYGEPTQESSQRERQRMTAAMRAMGELTPKEQGDVLNFMAELRRRKARG
jgi:transcriptional regulator with XRE-family HTH domain